MRRTPYPSLSIPVAAAILLGACAQGAARRPLAYDAGGGGSADGGIPGSDASENDAGASDTDASVRDSGPGAPCTSDAECDDGLYCDGVESCDPVSGCTSGTPPSCDDGDPCTTDLCNGATDACDHMGADADGDGYVAVGCAGGDDCADGSAAIHPGAAEVCDGVDNDCSGAADDASGLACVLGSMGASCTTMCGTSGTQSCTATCTLGACVAATETCGNGCDDNGNGSIDEGCVTAPPNDQCAGAIGLAGSGTRTTDTLVGATAQTSDCGDGVEVFYKFTLGARSIVYMDTFGTGFDTRISYRGTSCPGTSAFCADDSCSVLQTQVARVLAAGTHYFAVHTYSSATTPGPVTLRYQVLPAAGGDNVEITAPGTFTGNTSGSNVVTPTCGGASGPEDSFYFMQCPGVSRSISADTCTATTAYDTTLHVRGGAGALACNDDDFSCYWDSYDSYVTASTSGPGVYAIYVDGYTTTSYGTYQVIISW